MSLDITVHVLTPCKLVGLEDRSSEFYFEATEDGLSGLWTEWAPANQQFLQGHLEKVAGVKRVVWHRVTMENYARVIDGICALQKQQQGQSTHVALSVLDGTEVDGWPGLTVLKYVEKSGLPFTGANSTFFAADANKNVMKELLRSVDAATPRFVDLQAIADQWKRDGQETEIGREQWLDRIGQLQMPVIVKPSPSSGSCGITEKSVCYNKESALEQGLSIVRQFGAAYMEEFITGPEFTCLVTGDAQSGLKAYCPVERCFQKNLPSNQKFLSFNMKWTQWGADESAGKGWWYDGAPVELRAKIQQVAMSTYGAINAAGYARLDMRMDQNTGNLYVIDVNANCSLDGDEESALGIVLRTQGIKFPVILTDLIEYALKRHSASVNTVAIKSVKSVITTDSYTVTSASSNGHSRSASLMSRAGDQQLHQESATAHPRRRNGAIKAAV